MYASIDRSILSALDFFIFDPVSKDPDRDRLRCFSVVHFSIDELAGPVAIAAGRGLRISEILALETNGGEDSDSWDSDVALVSMRRTLKTPSAKRQIPVPGELNDFLLEVSATRSGKLFPVPRSTLRYRLKARSLLRCTPTGDSLRPMPKNPE